MKSRLLLFLALGVRSATGGFKPSIDTRGGGPPARRRRRGRATRARRRSASAAAPPPASRRRWWSARLDVAPGAARAARHVVRLVHDRARLGRRHHQYARAERGAVPPRPRLHARRVGRRDDRRLVLVAPRAGARVRRGPGVGRPLVRPGRPRLPLGRRPPPGDRPAAAPAAGAQFCAILRRRNNCARAHALRTTSSTVSAARRRVLSRSSTSTKGVVADNTIASPSKTPASPGRRTASPAKRRPAAGGGVMTRPGETEGAAIAAPPPADAAHHRDHAA